MKPEPIIARNFRDNYCQHLKFLVEHQEDKIVITWYDKETKKKHRFICVNEVFLKKLLTRTV